MATEVRYKLGTTLIGTGTVAPDYAFNWTNAPQGSHAITAELYVDGVLQDEDIVNVTVQEESEEYSITISSPDGSEFEEGTYVSLISDTNGEDGTVEYYIGVDKIGESADFPNYLINWEVTEGTHQIKAIFIRGVSQVATSNTITIVGTPADNEAAPDPSTPPEFIVSNSSTEAFNIKIL